MIVQWNDKFVNILKISWLTNIDLIIFCSPIRNRKQLEKLYEQKKIFFTLTSKYHAQDTIGPRSHLRSKYFHNGREEEEEYDTREIDTAAGIDKVRKDLIPIVHCAFIQWDCRLYTHLCILRMGLRCPSIGYRARPSPRNTWRSASS